MNLSLNHLEKEAFLPLSYLLIQNKIGNGKVIITHQFPNSNISHYDIINVGQVIYKLNNIKVSNIKDLRRAMMIPLIKDNFLYFMLETIDGARLYMKLSDMFKQDINFSNRLINKVYSDNDQL